MNIQSLKYFAAIAEGGTVSRVADQYYITQPALSRSIQRLEEELGCKLFDRSGSTLHLTRQGEAILPIAKQILYLAEDLHSVTQDYNSGRSGLLSIGCCGCETAVFYNLIGLIRRRWPAMNIETPKLFSIADMVKKVLNREIDCCFTHSGYKYGGDEALDHIPVQSTHLQLVVSHGHPFAAEKSVSIERLAEQKLLLWRRDMLPDYHNQFYEGCWSCGVYPKVVGEFTSKQELFSKVAADEGIAVIHSTQIYQPENAPFSFVDLVMPDGQLFYQDEISLFWNRQNNNPALPLITALVREALAMRE